MREKCLSSNYLVSIKLFICLGGYKQWKIKAFNAVGDFLEKSTITNIVAIGDSQIELDAANLLA